MPPWNYQAVTCCYLRDVEERQCDVVLVQAPGRGLASHDPAEDAGYVLVLGHMPRSEPDRSKSVRPDNHSANAKSSAASGTKIALSMPWNSQSRPAGWYQ